MPKGVDVLEKAGFFVGIIAVVFYLIGYLQKKRKNIILLNVTSRILYIIQYLLLSAFEGAALDISGVIASIVAGKKDSGFVKKHLSLFILGVDLLIIGAGILTWKNIFSLLPIIGVILHTGAFFINDEKKIRIVSFLGSPFWLAYNFISGAYGSCVGDVLSMVSIAVAMIRYDLPKKQDNHKHPQEEQTWKT